MDCRAVNVGEEDRRSFAAERWCFLGSIDDWIPLSDSGDLFKLVRRYGPHTGKESSYEMG
ncbi:MAG: hypothetical protein WBX00_06495 [Isosphaeraceae bacterium]